MSENKTFYFTFGQKHPLRDGWIEVSAPTAEQARDEIVPLFGEQWESLYEDADFPRAMFPAGRFGRVIEILR